MIWVTVSSGSCFHWWHRASPSFLPGGSDSKASACNVGDPGSIPELGRSRGEGNGNPLQYSCLENSTAGGAWWATVHGDAKSRIRLSDFTFSKFACKEYNQSDLGFDHLVMSMCGLTSCVVERGCLLWPVHSLDKTLLAFALLVLYSKAKVVCYSTLSADFLLLHSIPHDEKDIVFYVLVLEGLVGLHRWH